MNSINSRITGIAQNGKKRLIFIVVPQVRTKMREKGKEGKKHENGYVKRKQQ